MKKTQQNFTGENTIHINDEPFEPYTEDDFIATAKEFGVPYDNFLKALDKGLHTVDEIREFSANLHKHSD